MYNGLIQMPNNIYRAVIYIRLSEADEGKGYGGCEAVEKHDPDGHGALRPQPSPE